MRYIERVLPSLGETAVRAALARRGRRRHPRDPPRRAGRRRRQGHDPDGRADAPHRTPARPRAPTSFRIYWRDDTLVLDPGLLGRLRRQLMSQGRRNRQLPRVAKTLLDAMWRQVTGERGKERGREAFEDDMLGHAGFVEFASAWWPPLDATTVFSWLRDPEFLAPRRRGRGEPRGAAAAHQVVGVRQPVDRGRPGSTSCATRSATSRSAPTTSATSTRPACSRAASTSRS